MDHHAHHDRGGSEDQGLIFHHDQPYPCAYYVQSPSTLSHANSTDIRHMIQSPVMINYSSSRGSNAQYLNLHAKKISYDARSHDTEDLLANSNNVDNRLIIVKKSLEDDDDNNDNDSYYSYGNSRGRGGEGWWKMYFSYTNSDSSSWICLQISWRFLVSLIVAILVFYVASRPSSPKLSLEIEKVGEFGLGEGVDDSGVTTKLLSCNCSFKLTVDNNSKIFGLNIHNPTIHMSFQHYTFALLAAHTNSSMYADSGSRTTIELMGGTRNRPMYGAGREMEDILDSGHEIPLLIHLRFTSSFPLLLHLIAPKYHHHALCFLLLQKGYDKARTTHPFNSTCTFT